MEVSSVSSWTSEDEREWQHEKRQLVKTTRALIPFLFKLAGSILVARLMSRWVAPGIAALMTRYLSNI